MGGRDFLSDGDNCASSNSVLVMGVGITLEQAARSPNGSGYAFPDRHSANSGGGSGPNFIYEPLPEPSTGLMMVLGLAAIGTASARRRR